MTYGRSTMGKRAKRGNAPGFCARHNKKKYRSRNVALRAGEAKYGVRSEAYKCPECSTWHLTRRGTRLDDGQREHFESLDAADALTSALLGPDLGGEA